MWPVHQLDVTNAFLHGSIDETIYMRQPIGFEDTHHPDYVCKLKKAIYGLKQAPRQLFQTFSNFLKTLGFSPAKADSSLFTLHTNTSRLYLVIYVDDILITGNDSSLLDMIILQLNQKFDMKILGPAHSFLGIKISKDQNSYLLSQTQYVESILTSANMSTCKPLANPATAKPVNNNKAHGIPPDPKLYRQLTGSLQYLTITRPDIAFAVNQLCQHMHNPESEHFVLLHRLLRYIKGTISFGLPILQGSMELHSYSDVDWAGDKETRRSTSGYCSFLGNTLISWSVKKQHTVARSSTESEYRALASALVDILWL
ncbi:uncharacterized protein LOC110114371 [Dendrobium catenatum]|uniref:uncharacterized protein LOC110114371 n=1 Tax=Dendrobium catenatum TaxID=906689 RepID=UPI0009F577C8|nr:uncharacterized protein LOC110114371 [Dendrobium catenatum]